MRDKRAGCGGSPGAGRHESPTRDSGWNAVSLLSKSISLPTNELLIGYNGITQVTTQEMGAASTHVCDSNSAMYLFFPGCGGSACNAPPSAPLPAPPQVTKVTPKTIKIYYPREKRYADHRLSSKWAIGNNIVKLDCPELVSDSSDDAV